jgi:hypothetical protein
MSSSGFFIFLKSLEMGLREKNLFRAENFDPKAFTHLFHQYTVDAIDIKTKSISYTIQIILAISL